MAEFPPIGETTYPVTRAVTGPVTAGGGSPTVPIAALYLPGSSGNYADTPDSAAISVISDIDVRVWAAATDWTPTGRRQLMSIFGTSAGDNSAWWFSIETSGAIGWHAVNAAASSSFVASSVATGLGDGVDEWIRATWRASDGRTQFFTSDDGSSWSQLGTDLTANVGDIRDATRDLRIGSRGNESENFEGNIYRAQVYDGIGGTLVFAMDFTDETPGATSVTEDANGATVTVQQSGSPTAEIIEV